MSRQNESQLLPRNGSTLQVLVVARISGCQSQKEVSLEDQVQHAKEVKEELSTEDTEYTTIATKGKGEWLDRPELVEIEDLIRSRTLDLVIMEDIGRMVRGADAVRLCGIAADHGTRLIAPNDCIDTAEEHWEEDVISACRDHTSNQTHTSKRLKKKLMARFCRTGAATPCPTAGYIKPEGAETFSDWRKDDAAVPIITEGFRLLQATLNGETVAHYFNSVGFPVGPFCRLDRWDGRMVLRLYRNTILKGRPARGNMHTVKKFETGHRESVRNPKGPVYRDEPHLAYFTEGEFDHLQNQLRERNKHFCRKKHDGVDSRKHVPRKRTRSFGQHAICWYCGRHFVWGANGTTNSLMCSGARDWKCWNSIALDGILAAERLVAAISHRLYALEGFDEQFRGIVDAAARGESGNGSERAVRLEREFEKLQREKDNVTRAIIDFGPMAALRETLEELEARQNSLEAEQRYLASISCRKVALPASSTELRALLETEFQRLTISSFEFGEFIRQLVPEFYVYLVRLCDGGHLLPRARVKINLLGSLAPTCIPPELHAMVHSDFTLDLFVPPEREQIRVESVKLAAQKMKQREIAMHIKSRPTQTAVWKALELQRKMEVLELNSPYVLVDAPPDDYSKLKRHRNRKYRFSRKAGYEPPLR